MNRSGGIAGHALTPLQSAFNRLADSLRERHRDRRFDAAGQGGSLAVQAYTEARSSAGYSRSPAAHPKLPAAQPPARKKRRTGRAHAAAANAGLARLVRCIGMEVAVIDAVESMLGERIRKAREEAGLSLDELATATDMPVETIEAIEAGESLSSSALGQIAAATHRRVDFFLQPDDDTFAVLLRAGEGTTVGIRAAVDTLAKFTTDYEFLISLEE